jgi:hypothetical protein
MSLECDEVLEFDEHGKVKLQENSGKRKKAEYDEDDGVQRMTCSTCDIVTEWPIRADDTGAVSCPECTKMTTSSQPTLMMAVPGYYNSVSWICHILDLHSKHPTFGRMGESDILSSSPVMLMAALLVKWEWVLACELAQSKFSTIRYAICCSIWRVFNRDPKYKLERALAMLVGFGTVKTPVVGESILRELNTSRSNCYLAWWYIVNNKYDDARHLLSESNDDSPMWERVRDYLDDSYNDSCKGNGSSMLLAAVKRWATADQKQVAFSSKWLIVVEYEKTAPSIPGVVSSLSAMICIDPTDWCTTLELTRVLGPSKISELLLLRFPRNEECLHELLSIYRKQMRRSCQDDVLSSLVLLENDSAVDRHRLGEYYESQGNHEAACCTYDDNPKHMPSLMRLIEIAHKPVMITTASRLLAVLCQEMGIFSKMERDKQEPGTLQRLIRCLEIGLREALVLGDVDTADRCRTTIFAARELQDPATHSRTALSILHNRNLAGHKRGHNCSSSTPSSEKRQKRDVEKVDTLKV